MLSWCSNVDGFSEDHHQRHGQDVSHSDYTTLQCVTFLASTTHAQPQHSNLVFHIIHSKHCKWKYHKFCELTTVIFSTTHRLYTKTFLFHLPVHVNTETGCDTMQCTTIDCWFVTHTLDLRKQQSGTKWQLAVNTVYRCLLTIGHIFIESHCFLCMNVTKRRPTTSRVEFLIRLKQYGIADNAGEQAISILVQVLATERSEITSHMCTVEQAVISHRQLLCLAVVMSCCLYFSLLYCT